MKFILTLGLLSISLVLSAQKETIEDTFNEYMEATHADDVDQQLDYFYPQIFDFFPREKMLEGLKQTRNNGKISLENEKLVSISEVFEKSGGKYALVNYQVDLKLDVSDLKEKEGGDEAISNMESDYIEEHGEENVIFDEENFLFKITFNNTLYAILDKEIGSWKFLPKDETTVMITEQLIPESIRQKL